MKQFSTTLVQKHLEEASKIQEKLIDKGMDAKLIPLTAEVSQVFAQGFQKFPEMAHFEFS